MNHPLSKLFDDAHLTEMLEHWAKWVGHYWYAIPGRTESGCFGTGYNAWGVQTNQKFLSAMAVLASFGDERAKDYALAALRFSLSSHVTGDSHCTDGTRWGHTWISPLGIERMMHGVYLLDPFLEDADRHALKRVLNSEADWLLESYERNGIKGITGGLWESSGRNQPESNVWNGALLWRNAETYPDHPRTDRWREQAHLFLTNAVSIPEDAFDETMVSGRPIKNRFRGANFFPNFALDHRGFMNVGYAVICVSNAAILNFDCRLNDMAAPESLHHHQKELWQVLRRMIFSDGRLARIGGDTRARYSYCQAYLLPSLLYAFDHHDDAHALMLAEKYLRTVYQEQTYNGDGSFYGKRLAPLERTSPYYTTRLETDLACALAMVSVYARLLDEDKPIETHKHRYEHSVTGLWCEADHGSVLHRCPTRFASFSWRSFGLAQGLCLPPEDGHLAEWDRNLTGNIRVMQHQYERGKSAQKGYEHPVHMPAPPDRRLLDCRVESFEGGFVAWGAVMEGVDIELAEGWYGTDSAINRLVLIALPDGHSMVGLQYCHTTEKRVYFHEVQGLHLNIPNDLFNDFKRGLTTEQGEMVLKGPPGKDEVLSLNSRWVGIDDRMVVLGLYGADSLSVSRSINRRGGVLKSLYVEEIGWPIRMGPFAVEPNAPVLDVGWMLATRLAEKHKAAWLEANSASKPTNKNAAVRGLRVTGADGRTYEIWVNFSEKEQTVASSLRPLSPGIDHPGKGQQFRLEPGQAGLFVEGKETS